MEDPGLVVNTLHSDLQQSLTQVPPLASADSTHTWYIYKHCMQKHLTQINLKIKQENQNVSLSG